MARAGETIVPLGRSAINSLRAGVSVIGFDQAIAECVANSIDAGASAITVTVAAHDLSFRVEDDGRGIQPDSFTALAVRYHSSKHAACNSLAAGFRSLGYRGEALASIAEVAQLEVSSRSAGSFETFCKVVRAGSVARCGPVLEQLQQHGTLVVVKHFLASQPVRRRHVMDTR